MARPSATQTEQSALLRGQDYDDTETNKALAHKLEQETISKARTAMAKGLKAPVANLKALEKKTLARADSSPSYEDGYP